MFCTAQAAAQIERACQRNSVSPWTCTSHERNLRRQGIGSVTNQRKPLRTRRKCSHPNLQAPVLSTCSGFQSSPPSLTEKTRLPTGVFTLRRFLHRLQFGIEMYDVWKSFFNGLSNEVKQRQTLIMRSGIRELVGRKTNSNICRFRSEHSQFPDLLV